jgi:hypothetical protein
MPISPKKPLTLVQIAKRWSHELRGTPLEESPEEILDTLMTAVLQAV